MKMKVEVVNRTDDRIKFNVSGIRDSIANALRRIIISEVPIMAIEEVTFHENSSAMDDEALAHRLGLIPLKTDLAGPDSMEINLNASGPKTVYSSELKPTEIKVKGKLAASGGISAYDKTLIIKLMEKQGINLKAIARLGIGREHIKWQGGLASYDRIDDGSFEFFVESYGQMPVEDLIGTSFKVFDEKISELKSLIK